MGARRAAHCARQAGGGKRRVNLREMVNGVMYILSTGCQWRYLPKDLPPRSTVHDYLGLWNWMARLIGSITSSTSSAASGRTGKPAPRPASSTARA
jgi:Putative transposase of IS4/5 family (DUF4096)